ncbi:probable palmitoyltransferase ZDHHC24 [Lineus longissimus]|uniref:probable palmitoyltransferase ZDHHC24 n=1 Tax=Lineus longissimus TaxID=88925 RepID=UPI00315CCD84
MRRRLTELFPKVLHDRITFVFFLLGGPFCVWYEFYLVMPTYTYNPDLLWVHKLVVSVIFAGVYGNLFFMISSDTSTKPERQLALNAATEDDPSTDKKMWNYCEKCERLCPPRSHHCKICNVCILRRDHHCWFSGYCVGHTNQRHYIMTIAYCWLAGLYAHIYQIEFIRQTLGFSFRTLISVIAPHMVWLLGYYTNWEFFIAALFSLAVGFFLLLTWLLQIQLAQVMTGQTKHERTKGMPGDDKGFIRNIQEVLGTRWYLVWVCPFALSPLPGDGIHYGSSFRKSD